MKTLLLLAAAAAIALSNTAGCASASGTTDPSTAYVNPPAATATAKKTLRAFRSERELKDFFRKLAEEQRREARRQRVNTQMSAGADAASNAASPAPVTKAEAYSLADSKSKDDESVTNAQHAGVDEGGIVKLHGNHLVVLRRGRLFTVEIGGNALKPISSLDAFGPDVDPGGAWYDEMIVSGDTIAVIGYSYQRGGTEIGLFYVDAAGRLSYRDTYHLRSNDYYSSRNYASRLIGSKLIFYTPLYMSPWGDDPLKSFPSMRKWHRGAKEDEFRRIVSATRVYRPERAPNAANGLALHTVTVCDLARSELACEATAVVGPPGRVFYVSPSSVYVWTNEWVQDADRSRPRSTLYRLPLDGSGPSALGVSGSPVDQFSFLESEDRHLNVLVRSDSIGDGMWGAEVAAGDVGLMRVPVESITDGTEDAPVSAYRRLPKPEGYTFQNRYVGDYLLYGTGSGWGRPEKGGATLYAVRWKGGAASEFQLPHGVDRIESMGGDAVVVGTDGRDLHFTGVRLGKHAAIAGRYTREGASQGELRSHGFFYKPDGEDSGLLGLPIQRPGRPGYKHLFEDSAAILFLRNDSLNLKELGELGANPEGSINDSCRASCVDWYGNARPLFVKGRVFALLGYEIVEGALDDGRMRETRRVNYSPGRMKAAHN